MGYEHLWGFDLQHSVFEKPEEVKIHLAPLGVEGFLSQFPQVGHGPGLLKKAFQKEILEVGEDADLDILVADEAGGRPRKVPPVIGQADHVPG